MLLNSSLTVTIQMDEGAAASAAILLHEGIVHAKKLLLYKVTLALRFY